MTEIKRKKTKMNLWSGTMPRKSFEVDIQPEVMRWARRSMGRSIIDVAKQLNISEDIVRRWERGTKKPRLNQLKKLARFYKRPLAVFFLPMPPKEYPFPTDFRKLSDGSISKLSQKTLLAFRKARRIQSLTTELAGTKNTELLSEIGIVSVSNDPEVVATKIREILKIDFETQSRWKTDSEALNYWIKSIEKLGILVIQFSVPLEDGRAFSISDGGVPLIVLNSADEPRPRIFSLFHEIGHILLKGGSICNPFEVDENSSIEVFCNHIAGAVLVPRAELLSHKTVRRKPIVFPWTDGTLDRIASSFKVSREVVLRRLLFFGRTPPHHYNAKRNEWKLKREQKQLEQKQRLKEKGGPQNIPQKCIRENGPSFVSLVLSSYKKATINYSDVGDYLGVRLKHVPKIERILEA